jgi:hypothetical protein
MSIMRLELPEDVKEFLLRVQLDKKIGKGSGFYSLEQTIIYSLRELMELKGFHPLQEKEKEEP